MARPKTSSSSKASGSSGGSSSSSSSSAAPEVRHVDSTNARSDSDVGEGHFAEVTGGEHEGKYGVVESFVEFDKKDGYPKAVVLRTRDDNSERIVVAYKDLEPTVAGRR